MDLQERVEDWRGPRVSSPEAAASLLDTLESAKAPGGSEVSQLRPGPCDWSSGAVRWCWDTTTISTGHQEMPTHAAKVAQRCRRSGRTASPSLPIGGTSLSCFVLDCRGVAERGQGYLEGPDGRHLNRRPNVRRQALVDTGSRVTCFYLG